MLDNLSAPESPDQWVAFLIFLLIHQGVGLNRWASCQYRGLYLVYAQWFWLSCQHSYSQHIKFPFTKKPLYLCLVVTLESLTESKAVWLQIKPSEAGQTVLVFCTTVSCSVLQWIENRACKKILLVVMLMNAKCNICGWVGQNNRETNRQWKLLPCPGILLGLLIDRTSHSAILHRSLPGKIPLFL